MPSKSSSSREPRWKNPVKNQLAKGKPVIGVVITVNNVEVAAKAAALPEFASSAQFRQLAIAFKRVKNIAAELKGQPPLPLEELAGRLHPVVRFDNLALLLHEAEGNTLRLHVLERLGPTLPSAPVSLPVGEVPAGLVLFHFRSN